MNSVQEQRAEGTKLAFGPDSEATLIEASGIEGRLRAWQLLYAANERQGYIMPGSDRLSYGLHDAFPETTTFLVERDGRDVAALTVAMDHPVPIPANGMYRNELDVLRRQGRRPVEIVALCCLETDKERRMETVKQLVRAAIQTACHGMNGTDLILLVPPAHASAWRRIFLFKRMGEIRRQARYGGAPVLPMRLDLTAAEADYRDQYGSAEGSFYDYFFAAEESLLLARAAARRKRPLPREALARYFFERRPLLARVSEAIARHAMGPEESDVPTAPQPRLAPVTA